MLLPGSLAGGGGGASSTSTRDGERIEDPEVLERIRAARHPAGLGGRSGSARIRSGTSRRPAWTRGGASNTATTTSGGSGATARSSPQCSISRRSLPKLRDQVERDLRRRNDLPRAGARLRRQAARPRLLPDRFRGLRRGERDLRDCDHAEAPRHASAAQRVVFDYEAKGGKRRVQDDRGSDDLRAGEELCASGGEGATSCSPIATAGSGAISALTEINEYIKGVDRGGPQRQGLPYLERDGAGGRRAGGLSAGARHEHEGRPQPGKAGCGQAGVALPRATRRRSAGPPTSTRGSSTASMAGSRSGGCSSGCRRSRRLAGDSGADRGGRARPHRSA